MKNKEKIINITLVIATIVMTIFRFLLNEKGRVTPDSIRYMKAAHDLPMVDNAMSPLGYPLLIKIVTFLGTDEFWSSKLLGIVAIATLVFLSQKFNYYKQETIITCALFSFVTLFSATLTEGINLVFVFLLIALVHSLIKNQRANFYSVLGISLTLITLYNIRYSSVFIIAGVGLFGLLQWKKKYAISLIFSAAIATCYVILYKFLLVDRINVNYVNETFEWNDKTTLELIIELGQGLATTFNPFIHIANPNGGIINIGIYGIGIANIAIMMYLFLKKQWQDSDRFIFFISILGIICTFFIQYCYWIDPIDYRLLSPFSFGIWLLYFKELNKTFGSKIYLIPVISIFSGLGFTWLSKGNYLENRKQIETYLEKDNLEQESLEFYVKDIENLEDTNLAELISTVNSDIKLISTPKDTLKRTTLTPYKVLQKIKIDKNKYQ